jgi:microcystin-dependent protein
MEARVALTDPPLYVQADAHPARLFRAALTEMWDEGVLRQTNFKVVQRNAGAGGPNFSVDVGVGRAVVKGDSDPQQGNYMITNATVLNDASTAITSAPSAGNHRKDLVILEMKDDAEDGGGINLGRIRVLPGTPVALASTPVVPSLPISSIALAEIGPITNGTTTITDSIIVDVRPLAGRVCTPGTLEQLAGTQVPTGWLEADGTTKTRTAYPDLFAAIGTSYNVGGEAGTDFRLPLGRGRVFVPALVGQAQVDAIGERGGEYTHTQTIAEMAAHNHGAATGAAGANHAHGVDPVETQLKSNGVDQTRSGPTVAPGASAYYGLGPVGGDELTVDVPAVVTGLASNDHQHTVAAEGSGTAFNVMQPYQVVGLAVIRAL